MDNVRREGCRSLYPSYIYFTCVTERAFTLVSNTTHKDIDDSRGEPSPSPRSPSVTHRPLTVRTKPLQTFKASTYG